MRRLIYLLALLLLFLSHIQLTYGGPTTPAGLARREVLVGIKKYRMSRRSKRQLVHKHLKGKQDVCAVDSKESLRCGLLNTDGLSEGTFLDVENTILQKDLDFCVLLETKRRAEDPGTDIKIDGYDHSEIKRSDVAGDRDGGGIVFYTKQSDGLVFRRHAPDIGNDALAYVNQERFWITLSSQSHKTAICGLYLGQCWILALFYFHLETTFLFFNREGGLPYKMYIIFKE